MKPSQKYVQELLIRSYPGTEERKGPLLPDFDETNRASEIFTSEVYKILDHLMIETEEFFL